jgi:acyl homoserine lactone synthase
MIRFLYADQLDAYPVLTKTMHIHRADQFKGRLNWDVSVNALGEERDQYDDLNPLYVIWQNPDGTHGGSMRGLPTTGRTMTNEHFLHLTDGVRIQSPLIWEVTRFCLAPGASAGVAASLMLAGAEFCLRFGIEQVLGVFDARMVRIYNRIGFAPEVLGVQGEGREAVSVGLWTFTEASRDCVAARCGVPVSAAARWFESSFHAAPAPAFRAAPSVPALVAA